MKRIIIIGGGAAGMMAALAAADAGAEVWLLEKNEKLGKKLFITGKGRCNVTNAADMDTLFANVCTNRKFLYSAFYGYDNRAVMAFLEEAGCPLKTERGDRVFPVSDHSSDVIAAFQRELKRKGVKVLLHTEVKALLTEGAGPAEAGRRAEDAGSAGAGRLTEDAGPAEADGRAEGSVGPAEADGRANAGTPGKDAQALRAVGVQLADGRKVKADGVVVCTGGISYPLTGSTGDGYRFAEETGHRLTAVYPALVPLRIKESWCGELMGLSLKNVAVRLRCGKKEVYSGFGEMLFTHFGVSGPLVLSASSHYVHGSEAALVIDLKPAMDLEQLDRRILRDFEENKNRRFKNSLGGLFPAKLIPVMVELSGIHPDKRVNEITREERRYFAERIKELPLTVTGACSFAEAIITRGGVSVKDVNPSTMESKKVKELYFAGEVLDVDALTGGFNLQIAWSTGHLAGISAAQA